MNKKFIYILSFFICLSFFSCQQNNDQVSVDYKIVSPSSDRTYYNDSVIVFSTDLNSQYLQWISSIDGELGTGYYIATKLSAGKHVISLLHTKTSIVKTVEIEVLNRKEPVFAEMISGFPYEIPENRKTNEVAFLSLKGSASNVSQQSKGNAQSDLFHPVCNSNLLQKSVAISKKTNSRSAGDAEEKDFFIINTGDQSDSHKIKGIKIESPASLSVYVEKNVLETNLYNENIQKCIQQYEKIVLPRLKTMYGGVADLDRSRTLTVVFSQTINSEGKAVGFFYPMDFFPNESDINSEDYNPYSNEMDVIYVGIPVTEEQDNYSVQSITATLAHETTHAIAFSERVIFTELSGKKKLDQLEVFLDEGLAHLSESLCGFGESGGNSRFVDYYLKNSKDYSLCEKDALGYSDSIGQRGAMSYFLYWLFDKAGGREWNSEKNRWEDSGGFTFLKKIVISESAAWESIGEAFGRPTDLLFLDFGKELLLNQISFSEEDPETKESVFSVHKISAYEKLDSFSILPYSFFVTDLSDREDCFISGDNLSGQIYVLFIQ
ncbi:MAG: hypothetical protein MJ185_07485 [Treponema sp.]|nr:hypothetical protein [Treponema sp.]